MPGSPIAHPTHSLPALALRRQTPLTCWEHFIVSAAILQAIYPIARGSILSGGKSGAATGRHASQIFGKITAGFQLRH